MTRLSQTSIATVARKHQRVRLLLALMAILVAMTLAWRVVRWALGFPIWGDEAFIIISLQTRGLAGLWVPLEHGQVAPLGFMWAERLAAGAMGWSERALRLWPLLCGSAGVLLFWRVARRVLDLRCALLAVGMLASSYYPVRHSVEVKPYAQDLFVSIALLSLGWAVHRRPGSVWRWAALIVFGATSVWLSYPAVFIAGAVGVLLAWDVLRPKAGCHGDASVAVLNAKGEPSQWHPRRLTYHRMIGTALYAVTVCASFAAMYFFYGRPHAKAAAYMTEIQTWAPWWPPVEKPWLLPWWLVKTHAGTMMAYPVGGKNFGSAPTLLWAIVGCVALWRWRHRRLLLLLLAPLPLMFAAAVFKKYPYGGSQRICQHMAPIFCLLAGVGLAWVLRRVARPLRKAAGAARRPIWPIVAVTVVLLCIGLAGMAADLLTPYKKASDSLNRQYVRDLAGETRPGDEWVFFNSLGPSAYAPDATKWGGSAARLHHYVLRYGWAPVRWAPPSKDVALPAGGGRLWLLVYRDNKSQFPQGLFDAYLAEIRARLGQPEYRKLVLTSAEDPKRRREEAIEVYLFGR